MREIDVHELARRLAAGAPTVIVDIREPWEHEIAALPGGTLIPLGALTRRAEEVQPPPGALVVTVCHHGIRSLTAVSILEQAGLTDVASLRGGLDAWSRLVDPSMPRY